jgi:hypothetical protein
MQVNKFQYSVAERPHNGSPPSSHEATGSSAEGVSASDNGSSNSAGEQASLVSTTPAQSTNPFVFSAVSETIVISGKA